MNFTLTLSRNAAFVFVLLFITAMSGAAAPEPVLGKKGKVLVEENFDGGVVPKGWSKNTGVLAVAAGALHASELAGEKHVAAFRKLVPLRDCAVQVDFKFAGATMFNLGFDPDKGELKKQGHLFSLVVTPESWSITEHPDKADEKSRAVVRAKAAVKFAPGEWFTLLLEVKGDAVVARVAGREPLRATAKDFHVKKPGLVFRVGGKDGQEVRFDNVRVWELQ